LFGGCSASVKGYKTRLIFAISCVKVKGTDRGVKLTKEGHQEVADVALQLAKFCVDAPVKCPLIFGGW
jgi:hypothetical protein